VCTFASYEGVLQSSYTPGMRGATFLIAVATALLSSIMSTVQATC
jgi:hypothetical protein